MKLGAFLLVFFTLSVLGSEIAVKGRDYTFSCGYFTSIQGDLSVAFTDTTLAWGTTVSLIAGWEGREGFPEKRFAWKERAEILAKSTAPFTWTADLTKVLHERSKAELKDTLNFVIKVTAPGRAPEYINGGSPWGYYRARLITNGPGRCVNNINDLPDYRSLVLETIDKD
ncbi:MAG: hypothetical protein EXR74_08095 [Bdellovibrionales bacterium]|nr:hypothetical protein [Bdellovibrionales bacterium]